MAGERTFVVKFISDTAQALGGFKTLDKGLTSLSDGINKGVSSSLSALIPSFKEVAIAGAAAFAGTAAFLYKAAEAAAEDEKSQALLALQLKTTTGANDLQIESIMKTIATMQAATGVSEDQLRPALAGLVRATGDVSKSQDILALSLDVAAGTGKSVTDVALGLSKAYLGNVGALSRLGIPLDENTKKSKDFGAITEQLSGLFGGAAATNADTFSGGLARLKVGFGEVVESVGKYLLPYLETFVKFLNDKIVPALQLAVDNFKEQGLAGAMYFFLAAMGTVGVGVVTIMEKIAMAIGNAIAGTLQLIQQVAVAAGVAGALARDPKLIALSISAVVGLGIARDKLDAFLEGLPEKFDALRASVEKAANAIRMLGRPPKDVSDALDRMGTKGLILAQTLRTASDAVGDGSGGGGGGGLTKVLVTAAEKLKKYTSALTTATSAQKAMEASGRAVAKAQQGLSDANANVADAQAAYNAAIKGGDPLKIAAAQKVLDQAQRGLARAGFNVEQSLFAVTDAEKKLAAVRKDPESTPQIIREAEIALAEAKFSVSDATDSQTEAAIGLKDAQLALNESTSGAIVGGALFLSVSKALKDAEDARAEASQRVTDAIDAQTEAIGRFNDALKAANDLAALYPKVSGGVANPFAGMAPVSVPSPSAVGGSTMNNSPINVTVNAGLGTNGAAVGKEIVDYISDFVSVGGRVSSKFLRFGM